MKHHCARSSARSTPTAMVSRVVAASTLLALFVLPAQAQSTSTAESRPASTAQSSTAAYTADSSRQQSTAVPASAKRQPRWFNERRHTEEQKETSGRFERLSYTRYEGEAEADSGTCVYYQNSYTYSCR
jgi:hypothetical protein